MFHFSAPEDDALFPPGEPGSKWTFIRWFCPQTVQDAESSWVEPAGRKVDESLSSLFLFYATTLFISGCVQKCCIGGFLNLPLCPGTISSEEGNEMGGGSWRRTLNRSDGVSCWFFSFRSLCGTPPPTDLHRSPTHPEPTLQPPGEGVPHWGDLWHDDGSDPAGAHQLSLQDPPRWAPRTQVRPWLWKPAGYSRLSLWRTPRLPVP